VRRYKRNRRLEVFWYDIVQDPKWLPETEMNREPDCLCATLGYYHHHDKQFLYLSHTISSKERDKTTIPLGCIKKVIAIKDKELI